MLLRAFTLLALLSGLLLPCGSAAEPEAPAPTATASLSTAVVDMDGRAVELGLKRVPQARATLVFENGLGLTLESWQALLPALADCCNVLLYNRPGIGRSEAFTEPGAPLDAADRLLRLLQAQQLPAPYVLVGHSLGGQYVQLFAQRHPGQVAGLVLVDALPLGVARPYPEFPWYTRLGLWLFAPAALRQEIAAIHPMGEQLLKQPGRFAGPMARLLALSDAPKPQGLVRDLLKGVIYAEDFGVWAQSPDEAEQRMAELYPHAALFQVRAHHRVQEHAPAQVAEAIRAVLERLPSASAGS